jgi:hypothetical protein
MLTINDLSGYHANVLPIGCQCRLILLKFMHNPSHLLSHVDIPINIVFENQSGCDLLVNNPGKVQKSFPVSNLLPPLPTVGAHQKPEMFKGRPHKANLI